MRDFQVNFRGIDSQFPGLEELRFYSLKSKDRPYYIKHPKEVQSSCLPVSRQKMKIKKNYPYTTHQNLSFLNVL